MRPARITQEIQTAFDIAELFIDQATDREAIDRAANQNENRGNILLHSILAYQIWSDHFKTVYPRDKEMPHNANMPICNLCGQPHSPDLKHPNILSLIVSSAETVEQQVKHPVDCPDCHSTELVYDLTPSGAAKAAVCQSCGKEQRFYGDTAETGE